MCRMPEHDTRRGPLLHILRRQPDACEGKADAVRQHEPDAACGGKADIIRQHESEAGGEGKADAIRQRKPVVCPR